MMVFAAQSEVLANGRPSASTNLAFQPGDDQLVALATTFGLLISEDDGGSFHWICEEAVGYGGTFDPDYAITRNGDIYATTFSRLRVSRDGGCTFEATEFYNDLSGGEDPILLDDYWVGEVEVAADDKIWAATSTDVGGNDVYTSSDGIRFDSANLRHPLAWWTHVRVSKSNPEVVYVSGYRREIRRKVSPELSHPVAGDEASATTSPDRRELIFPAEALLYKTINGGGTWAELDVDEFAFGRQPHLYVEGISPNNPDIVFARVLGARFPQGDDLYRSTDGGTTWNKVLEMEGRITAFVIRGDDSVLVATVSACTEAGDAGDKGCVRRSMSGAANSWEKPAVEPKLACLQERGADELLFGCASNWEPDNFALGTSMDSGESWAEVLRFAEIKGPLACPQGTEQHTCEQTVWPVTCLTLGLCAEADAGPKSTVDAGDANSADNSDASCFGCRAGEGGLSPLFLILAWVRFGRPWRRRASSSWKSRIPVNQGVSSFFKPASKTNRW